MKGPAGAVQPILFNQRLQIRSSHENAKFGNVLKIVNSELALIVRQMIYLLTSVLFTRTK